MTRIACPQCQVKLQLKPERRSSRVTCPKCQTKFDVGSPSGDGDHAPTSGKVKSGKTKSELKPETVRAPVAKEKPSAPPGWQEGGSSADLMRVVVRAFQGQTVRRTPTLGYRFALLFSAIGLLLLIIAYIACGIAIGYGLYLYATRVIPPTLHLRAGRAALFVGLMHLGVMGAGLAVLYSLIRPVFRRGGGEAEGRLLTSTEQPVVHCFVRALCNLIGAPQPDEIRMSLSPNASAARYRKFLGLFGGKLVLDIGAPLFYGMTLRSVAGIIAHELGHFSQATSGGLLRYIGTVAIWFQEATGRSSEIQEAIGDQQGESHGSFQVLVFVAWITTGLGVLLLAFFALLSRMVTFYLMRQMEFDADRYEAEVAGSAQFAKTFERLGELQVGFENTIRAVFTGDLGLTTDIDLAKATVIDADNLSDKHRRRAARHLRPARAQWFDSHPSPTERIAAVAKQAHPGIFQLEGPASRLLQEAALVREM